MFITAIFLIAVVAAAIYGPISDYYTIKDADPAMIALAKKSGMSRKGEILFLRTKPQLVYGAQFSKDCNTTFANNNGASILGCYSIKTNRIYILLMPSNLYNVEVTTAAYELLHPIYIDLSKTDSSSLNHAIEAGFSAVSNIPNSCTDDLPGQVALFAKTEPGSRDNELFSLLGTECNNLPASLSKFYSPYFTDLQVNVSYNQQTNDLFQNDENQLSQLQNTINQYNDNASIAYENSVGWADIGNQSENSYYYNVYTQDIDNANNAVDQYNSLVEQINLLITAITGGQPVENIQNIQSQSAQ